MGSGEKKHTSPSLSAYSFADRKGRFGRYMLLFGAQGTIALLLRGYLVARARWLYRGEGGDWRLFRREPHCFARYGRCEVVLE